MIGLRARLTKTSPTVILVALASLLRLPTLGIERFWTDEAFNIWLSLPSTNFWQAIIGDVHPPLWNILQRLDYAIFGFNEWTFRLPSALAGIGAVYCVWRIALELDFPRKTAFLTGILAAGMPGAIYFSQDARMYMGLSLFVLIATWAALRRNWYVFTPAAIASVYTHNTGLLYIFALGTLSLVTSRSRLELAKTATALAVTVAAWSPWAVIVLHQTDTIGMRYWPAPVNIFNAIQPLTMNTVGWRMSDALTTIVYAAIFALTGLGFIASRRWLLTRRGLLILAPTVIAPGLLVLISVIWTPILVFRALQPAALALLPLWAYGLLHISAPNRKVAQLVALTAFGIALLAQVHPNNHRDDLVTWLAPIHENWRLGDLIYHTNANTAVSTGIYLRGLPYAVRPSRGSAIDIPDGARAAFGLHFQGVEALSANRIWLIVQRDPWTQDEEIRAIEQLLGHPHTLIQRLGETTMRILEIYLIDMARP